MLVPYGCGCREAPRMELLLHTAPEVLLRGEAPGQKADVYALGTLLWEVRRDGGSGLLACLGAGQPAGGGRAVAKLCQTVSAECLLHQAP